MVIIVISIFRTCLKYSQSKLYFGSLEHYHLYKFLPDTTKRWFMAKWLLKCLDKFFASDSETLCIYHVPLITDVFENECEDIDGHQRQKVLIYCMAPFSRSVYFTNFMGGCTNL